MKNNVIINETTIKFTKGSAFKYRCHADASVNGKDIKALGLGDSKLKAQLSMVQSVLNTLYCDDLEMGA